MACLKQISIKYLCTDYQITWKDHIAYIEIKCLKV